jgi:glycosyltransferase involved in cell wall biosynthesis
VRILIFHGYLLRGTGSNIYNVNLARALAGLGHEVHLFCQDRMAVPPKGVTIHVPDIGRLLPVYVADHYEGFDALPFPEINDIQLSHYLDANIAAIRSVPAPDIALANHLVMGPAILARGLGGRAPYAVKIHGSALEYTVRPHRERFLPYALEGIRGASGVLVGSRHTAESLWEVLGDEQPLLPGKTRLGPPGVDVKSFRPCREEEAVIGLRQLADKLATGMTTDWGGEVGAAETLAKINPYQDRIVSYAGKLIVSKGVDLLLAAWPLVVARVPNARLIIVGFGTYRQALGRFVEALGRRDLDTLHDIAARGRELEGGPSGELRYLRAFLDKVSDEWLRVAPTAAALIHFTGRIEHHDLPALLSVCEAQVMPSTFPEAFGMVAVEAAACGALPLSARHSGMAEVTATLAPALPEALRPLLSFEIGPGAVEEIGSKLIAWLNLDTAKREHARLALAAETAHRYSWENVARGVIAAAQGRLAELPSPSRPVL